MRGRGIICYFYDFHMKRATFFVLLSFVFLCCSKSKNGSGGSGSSLGPDSPPLAGTVAATDTLEVMAHNVLGYGNGCQGSLESVLGCEKMSAFNPAPGSAGNLADHITDSVLDVSFPGRYRYAPPAAVLQALFEFSDKYPVTVKVNAVSREFPAVHTPG